MGGWGGEWAREEEVGGAWGGVGWRGGRGTHLWRAPYVNAIAGGSHYMLLNRRLNLRKYRLLKSNFCFLSSSTLVSTKAYRDLP